MTTQAVSAARAAALDRIDKAEKQFRGALIATAAVEGVLLLAFILLADFHNRMHVLLLVSTMLAYCTIGAGLFALGAWVNRCTQRVISAVFEAAGGS